MRRMKDMSAMQGGPMNYYGQMPDSYALIVNTAHPLINKVITDEENSCKTETAPISNTLKELEKRKMT